jgi:hypothetical protein
VDDPKMKLVTPTGLVPLSSMELRALCANPKTIEFVVAGVSRRWLYDLLDKVPGVWGTYVHQAAKGVEKTGRGMLIWRVRRKEAARDRGVLILQVRESLKALTNALEGLLLDMRVAEELGIADDEPTLSLEDLIRGEAEEEEDAPIPNAGSFSSLFKKGAE